MGEIAEVKKEDIFKRETTAPNPWSDPKFNKVDDLGGEPGFKVDDIPERLGLVQEGESLDEGDYYFYELEGMPENFGKKGQFLQTDGEENLDWAWPFWRKAGSTVYYKSGKVAIGHGAAQTILHISTPLSSEIRIQTSGESDPTISFKTTNTAHQVNLALDESAVADHVDFIGQTASVDTYFHVVAKVGQTAKVGVQIGSYRGELICGSAGHVSLKNITADLDLIFGIKDGAVNKTITWDADVDQLKHSAGLFDFHDDNMLTTGTLGAGQTTLADSTIADDARGLSSIFTLSADPAKSDGIALYAEGHIGDITTNGPTYGGGIWLNIDSGATLGADVRALDIGIYERGADCTGGNAYGLAIHLDFDSTNSPAAIYPFRLNCEVSGATPDALIFAANKSALGVTEGDFPYNNYLKIVVQDGTVYRIPLITEGAAEFIALHSSAELRFYDNGNYVGFEAPALSANQIWVLPSADGPANEVLGTDNSGNLIWRTHDELAGFAAGEHFTMLDEDDMATNSNTQAATQQSIKAYVGAQAHVDEKVKVDAAATAGYLGVAFGDGVLRVTENELTVADGGNFITLGLANHNTARTALGLAIGTNVLAYDAGLSNLAGIAMQADRFYYTSGDNTHVAGTITSAGRDLIDDANAGAQRTTLGLVIGTNVQAYDATIVVDADFSSNGILKRTGAGVYGIVADASANWNTAFGWGDHAGGGYAISGGAEHDGFSDFSAGEHFTMLDEDNMASNSATQAATQQSIKAYVDAMPGSGDVSAAANLTDHYVVRGNGGAKGVQTSTVIILDTGFMGIGVSPSYMLEVKAPDAGAQQVIAVTNSAGQEIFTMRQTGTAHGQFDVIDSGGKISARITAHAGGHSYFLDQNVGIGTATPNAQLVVAGATGARISILDLGRSNVYFQYDDAGRFEIGGDSGMSDGIYFRTYSGSYADRMVIKADGKVGINRTDPAAKLDVYLAGGGTAVTIDSDAGYDSYLAFAEAGTERTWLYYDATAHYFLIQAAGENADIFLLPNGTGVVRFGDHTAIGAETVTGYITIKDEAGNSRKLAVVS